MLSPSAAMRRVSQPNLAAVTAITSPFRGVWTRRGGVQDLVGSDLYIVEHPLLYITENEVLLWNDDLTNATRIQAQQTEQTFQQLSWVVGSTTYRLTHSESGADLTVGSTHAYEMTKDLEGDMKMLRTLSVSYLPYVV